MEGTIVKLCRFTEKGKPGECLNEAYLLRDKGMEGDCHAFGGKRQLTLLSGEARRWMENQAQPGLCFQRYKANLETEELETARLRLGMELLVGTAVLAVSDRKECFPECPLSGQGLSCLLLRDGVYLSVIRSGMAACGDSIRIQEKQEQKIR